MRPSLLGEALLPVPVQGKPAPTSCPGLASHQSSGATDGHPRIGFPPHAHRRPHLLIPQWTSLGDLPGSLVVGQRPGERQAGGGQRTGGRKAVRRGRSFPPGASSLPWGIVTRGDASSQEGASQGQVCGCLCYYRRGSLSHCVLAVSVLGQLPGILRHTVGQASRWFSRWETGSRKLTSSGSGWSGRDRVKPRLRSPLRVWPGGLFLCTTDISWPHVPASPPVSAT